MRNNYDVIIIGAGPSGLFSAYKLKLLKSDLSIAMIDKGKSIENRVCPMRNNPNQKCVHCNPCNIMCGFGGAGTFSDCKLSLTPFGVGGNIIDYVGSEKAVKLIDEVDNTYICFYPDSEKRKTIGTDDFKLNKIKTMCKNSLIDFTECPTKHLGTDGTYVVMTYMYKWLKEHGVEFLFNTQAEIETCNNECKTIICNKINDKTSSITLHTKNLVLAPGRSGNTWLKETISKFDIKTKNNKVDIGVRVELPANSVKTLTDNLYDMKLSYTDYKTGDKIRTFCTNPGGYVSEEHYDDDIILANGHSFANHKSNNTNFALLVTLNDSNLSSDYIKKVIKTNNSITKGKIMKQNFYDFARNPMKEKRNVSIEPTLKTAVDGDLNLLLPRRVADLIEKFIFKLDYITDDSIINDNTILYGIEAKFYSDLIEVDSNLQTAISGVYCIGDGAGITRGITQSAACGIAVAENIINNLG